MTPADQHALREALARAEAEITRLRSELVEALVRERQEMRDEIRREIEAEAATKAQEICICAEARARAAEAESARLKETVEEMGAALKPFAEAWDSVEDISEQGAGYVQDTDDAWVSGNASGGSYPLFKFGDLRRARSVLATIPPKENPDA